MKSLFKEGKNLVSAVLASLCFSLIPAADATPAVRVDDPKYDIAKICKAIFKAEHNASYWVWSLEERRAILGPTGGQKYYCEVDVEESTVKWGVDEGVAESGFNKGSYKIVIDGSDLVLQPGGGGSATDPIHVYSLIPTVSARGEGESVLSRLAFVIIVVAFAAIALYATWSSKRRRKLLFALSVYWRCLSHELRVIHCAVPVIATLVLMVTFLPGSLNRDSNGYTPAPSLSRVSVKRKCLDMFYERRSDPITMNSIRMASISKNGSGYDVVINYGDPVYATMLCEIRTGNGNSKITVGY